MAIWSALTNGLRVMFFKNSAIVSSQSTQSLTVVLGTREILASFLFPLACLTHSHKTFITARSAG